MENSTNQNEQKYDQENIPKKLDSEKDLVQDDLRSDSKSPKKSRSNSYSRQDISRQNSSDDSDFELGQKKNDSGYSKTFQN